MSGKDVTVIKVAGTGIKRGLCDYLNDGIAKTGLAVVRIKSSSDLRSSGEMDEWDHGKSQPRHEPKNSRCVVILELNTAKIDFLADFSIFMTDRPLEKLNPRIGIACRDAEVVLLRWGNEFDGQSELGMEKKIKSLTGARKVLVFDDEGSKNKKFQKMLDISFSRIGGNVMPDDIPKKVIDAVKKAEKDNKIACGTAHKIAHDLGVPIPLVGRALDVLDIKITKCELGCF